MKNLFVTNFNIVNVEKVDKDNNVFIDFDNNVFSEFSDKREERWFSYLGLEEVLM